MRKIIRYLAIIFNILGFTLLSIEISENGFPNYKDIGEFLLVLCLLVLPIINLIALILSSYSNNESWLSLYLKRKALEEKKKINILLNEASIPSDTNDTKKVL
jgi:hypothetical protein